MTIYSNLSKQNQSVVARPTNSEASDTASLDSTAQKESGASQPPSL